MNPPDDTDRRAAQVRAATFEFLSRRNHGETISLDAFCTLHADLLPDLRTALEVGLKRLRYVNEVNQAHGLDIVVPSHPASGGASIFPVVRGYQIVSEISAGGQGTVFKAIQDSTGRMVALKVVDAIASRNYQRFEREVQVLASIEHPGIVSVLDRGRTSTGAHYLTMDYISGRDLDAEVAEVRGKPEACRKIVDLFAHIAAALEPVHEAGIVHRDLKPSNVRITPSGAPRVIDFGLVQHRDFASHTARTLTVTGNIVGSIPWTSPEQASGAVRQVGPQSDVYSIGVMLYHALFGRFPYAVDGPLHETIRHICDRPPDVTKEARRESLIAPNDASLLQIVLKCLAKTPLDRFQSGGELAAGLRAYLAGQYKLARPPVRVGRRAFALTLSAATLCGGAYAVVSSRHSPLLEPMVIALPTLTNSAGMNFVQLPANTFTMGSPESEPGHAYGEDQHRVTIEQPFAIGTTEVTRKQFVRVMGYLPHNTAALREDCPVDFVTWDEAQAFCRKLSELDGRRYRLPTEAEWEYACRAGTRTMYAGRNNIDQIAWHKGNSGGQLHPVAQLSANTWGLFDIAGNAAEWVQDSYVRYPGDRSPSGEARTAKSELKVIRGGSVKDAPSKCRSAARDADVPNTIRPNVGLRVVMIGPASPATDEQAR